MPLNISEHVKKTGRSLGRHFILQPGVIRWKIVNQAAVLSIQHKSLLTLQGECREILEKFAQDKERVVKVKKMFNNVFKFFAVVTNNCPLEIVEFAQPITACFYGCNWKNSVRIRV